jgi:hypothetical protein
MTPKKDIVRKPIYTLPDGSPVPSMGPEFTYKESCFIFWYTDPGTRAFLNAGRAAVRAGYNPSNAVAQGYLLKSKPRIAEKIEELIAPAKWQLRDLMWQIISLCRDRMFFDVADFYRSCKRTVKIRGIEIEQEVNSIEAIPLDEISEKNRMCIDAVEIKTICGKDEFWYKLPNRDKAFDQFFKCYNILFPEKEGKETNWKETAALIREDIMPSVIAPKNGKAPEDAIEAL